MVRMKGSQANRLIKAVKSYEITWLKQRLYDSTWHTFWPYIYSKKIRHGYKI